ncbi:MAG: succinyl-diaminopimelate desuccinylase [Quisquiliibacterium sp.]
MITSPVRVLTEALIRCASVTPDDAGCQKLLIERLQPLGFDCETLVSGDVTNLWATRRFGQGPMLVFAGHTDVVPTGPLDKWHSNPFVPTERDGKLYGRGAADMKSSIAAFIIALEELLARPNKLFGGIGLLITSDEEGPATDGTIKVVDKLRASGEKLDYCIVGEPTSVNQLGDMIKNGRRGSMSARLTVRGLQGHIAYPHLARNPVHLFAPALSELVGTEWDQGNEYFPPTTWQISNMQAGAGATNIIPAELSAQFNFRFSTENTVSSLQARVCEILDRHGLDYSIEWSVSGHPFLTPRGELSDALCQAIDQVVRVPAELSTTGGTSDGRFIASICEQVVEFGPINSSIHKINEHIEIAALEPLKNIYRRTLEILLSPR